ncbi:MAG: nucleotidyltransferase domain-containing protein [Emticicia sp.]
MTPFIRQIAEEFKAELKKLYGDELSQLVLFGSHARGDFNEESDIDFAVVLKSSETRGAAEIFKISPVSTELGLKYSELISVLPISSLRLSTSINPIFQEIRREGISI